MYDSPWPEWAAAGVFTLLEGHVARAVHVSRSSGVTEQAANRQGHKHSSRLESRDTHRQRNEVHIRDTLCCTVCLCFL